MAMTSCGGSEKILAPPPPLRPDPTPEQEQNARSTRTDCDPIDPAAEPPALAFDERSIDEAQRLADDGVSKLRQSDAAGEMSNQQRQGLVTDAVTSFINALGADPYNVRATYNLAAAYARIKRPQCSVNLLTRMLQMRKHQSRKLDVEKSIDRLLGRGASPLDPDFNDMRSDPRFRELIRSMCDGTNDPACVLGRNNTQ
jgi:hypothetical protein